MAKLGISTVTVHAAPRRLPAILSIVLFALVIFCVVTLLTRQYQKHRGAGAVAAPGAPTVAYGETPETSGAQGRFTANIAYTSIAAPDNGKVTSQVTWDDDWFSHEPFEYNHELATASSVIAALAYAESTYYQAGSAQPAYMENALAKLGFDDVSTASYRYRSEIVDEVLNLFTDDSDTVAYTIARKHLEVGEGEAARDLILVSIRGSYGSEWLSNLKLAPEGGAHESSSEDAFDALEHGGYASAAEEVSAELNRWIAESRRGGAKAAVLLTGHSRGGAIANLVAAELDDADAGERSSRAPDVYAYTFASPATTLSNTAHDARYGNIFNIVNPADIMPYLPLRSWGYERYGVNLCLPAVDDVGFEEAYGEMRRSYTQTVGVESGYDPDDKRAVDRVLSDVSKQVATVQDLMTPAGVAAAIASCATHIDPIRILHGHYPSTYIAWMETLDTLV